MRWWKGSFIFNFQFGNVRYSEEAPLFEGSIKSFNKYHILDTSFLGLKIITWASYQSKLKARICPSSPTTKAAEKEHKDNKKNNFSPFLGSVGWKQECATQKDLKLSEWMSYPNSLMKLCLCLVVFLYRNMSHFGKFWSNFCLIHSSYWFYDHFFAWNHGTQICFLCETQKYGEKLNITWMIRYILYRNISNFLQFLGKYLPRSLYPLPLRLHFCLKSLWADILL